MNENRAIVPDEIISPDCNIDKSHKNIPIETIIEYRNRGLSYAEIAKLTGCSRQNIQQRLEAIEYSKEDLENFKKNRADVFAFMQSKLINSIDSKTAKEMSPYHRIVSLGILFDKERLERGKSTENLDVWTLTASLRDIERQEQEVIREVKAVLKDR